MVHRIVCRAVWVGVAMVSLAWLSAPALAQKAKPPVPNYDMLPLSNLDGTYKRASGLVLEFETLAGQPYYAQAWGETKVMVNGTAEKDFLSAGMFVAFTAPLDAKGNITEDVKEMTIITPNDIFRPGVYNSDVGDNKGPKQVIGQIATATKAGQFSVKAGMAGVKGKLAEDVTIKVAVSTIQLAKPGAKVTVRGRLLQPHQGEGKNAVPGKIIAEDITVTLQEPLTKFPAKKPAGKENPSTKSK